MQPKTWPAIIPRYTCICGVQLAPVLKWPFFSKMCQCIQQGEYLPAGTDNIKLYLCAYKKCTFHTSCLNFFTCYQVVAHLCAEVLFLLRVESDASSLGCTIIAVLTHYCYMASSFWSVLFAIEILQTVRSMYAVNQKSKKKFIRWVKHQHMST